MRNNATLTDMPADGSLMNRIRGEYREMPGLRLTSAQAQRLWNLDREQCDAVFAALIDAGVIRRTPDGSFVLA